MTEVQVYDPEIVEPASENVVMRAEQVRQMLLDAKEAAEDSFLDICELLLEAKEQAYHRLWGFGEFGQWVENGSGLKMKSRQAYYLVNIAKAVRQLGISREDVKKGGISNLKEIFTLDAAQYGGEIKKLVGEASEMSLDEVKKAVKGIKQDHGESVSDYMTLRIDEDAKTHVEAAFKLVRLNHGSTVNSTGDEVEISNAKALELICIEYVNTPANLPEGVNISDLYDD